MAEPSCRQASCWWHCVLLTSWLTYWRDDIVFMSWHSCWYHNVLFDVMTYFVTLWRTLRTFWLCDVLFSPWRKFWGNDVVFYIYTFNVMSYLLAWWQTVWRHDILFILLRHYYVLFGRQDALQDADLLTSKFSTQDQ